MSHDSALPPPMLRRVECHFSLPKIFMSPKRNTFGHQCLIFCGFEKKCLSQSFPFCLLFGATRIFFQFRKYCCKYHYRTKIKYYCKYFLQMPTWSDSGPHTAVGSAADQVPLYIVTTYIPTRGSLRHQCVAIVQ